MGAIMLATKKWCMPLFLPLLHGELGSASRAGAKCGVLCCSLWARLGTGTVKVTDQDQENLQVMIMARVTKRDSLLKAIYMEQKIFASSSLCEPAHFLI